MWLAKHLSLFSNEFNKFNNTGARTLDSIYHWEKEIECEACEDKLGVFHANQTSMCLDPHLN